MSNMDLQKINTFDALVTYLTKYQNKFAAGGLPRKAKKPAGVRQSQRGVRRHRGRAQLREDEPPRLDRPLHVGVDVRAGGPLRSI